MKANFLAKFLNVLVTIFLVLIIFTFFTLPFLVDEYFAVTGAGVPDTTLWIKIFLCMTAIPFFVLLIMIKKLCRNILQNRPFSEDSIRAFNVISICAFSDFLLYALGTVMILRNLLSLTLMVAAFMIGLVSLILSHLIKVAKEIKEENDLTI